MVKSKTHRTGEELVRLLMYFSFTDLCLPNCPDASSPPELLEACADSREYTNEKLRKSYKIKRFYINSLSGSSACSTRWRHAEPESKPASSGRRGRSVQGAQLFDAGNFDVRGQRRRGTVRVRVAV